MIIPLVAGTTGLRWLCWCSSNDRRLAANPAMSYCMSIFGSQVHHEDDVRALGRIPGAD